MVQTTTHESFEYLSMVLAEHLRAIGEGTYKNPSPATKSCLAFQLHDPIGENTTESRSNTSQNIEERVPLSHLNYAVLAMTLHAILNKTHIAYTKYSKDRHS
jgi:hypothetical protein